MEGPLKGYISPHQSLVCMYVQEESGGGGEGGWRQGERERATASVASSSYYSMMSIYTGYCMHSTRGRFIEMLYKPSPKPRLHAYIYIYGERERERASVASSSYYSMMGIYTGYCLRLILGKSIERLYISSRQSLVCMYVYMYTERGGGGGERQRLRETSQ